VDRNQIIVGHELNICEWELILLMNCGPEPSNCGPEPPVPPCSAWFRLSTVTFLKTKRNYSPRFHIRSHLGQRHSHQSITLIFSIKIFIGKLYMYILMKVIFKTNLFICFSHF
jgi:hypothetical protein